MSVSRNGTLLRWGLVNLEGSHNTSKQVDMSTKHEHVPFSHVTTLAKSLLRNLRPSKTRPLALFHALSPQPYSVYNIFRGFDKERLRESTKDLEELWLCSML
jgi:hypothetical protein